MVVVLYWVAMWYAASAFIRKATDRSIAVVAGILIVLGTSLLTWMPGTAPFFAMAVFSFVYAPVALDRAATNAAAVDDYRRAFAFSFASGCLHPFGKAKVALRFHLARMLESFSRYGEADDSFVAIAGDATYGVAARFALCRSRDDFAALLTVPDRPTGVAKLRTMGAAGLVGDMVEAYDEASLGQSPSPGVEIAQALAVLTYAGRPDGVRACLRRPESRMGPASAAYARAYAETVAGGPARGGGLAGMRALSRMPDGVVARRASDVMADPPPLVILDDAKSTFLDSLESAIGALPANPRPALWGTYALVGLNCASYVLENVLTQSGVSLGGMGALDTEAFAWPWDAWRLVTETLLHGGVIHLGTNMVGLVFLGAAMEPLMGRLRFLALYAASGILANALIVALTELGMVKPMLLVGASGAIMGLVGGLAGATARNFLSGGGPRLRALFLGTVSFLVLQPGFDMAVAHVSTAAHMLGAASGFLIGLFMPITEPEDRVTLASFLVHDAVVLKRAMEGKATEAPPSPKRRPPYARIALVAACVAVGYAVSVDRARANEIHPIAGTELSHR